MSLSTILVWNISIVRRIEQYVIKMPTGINVNSRYYCQILTQLENSQRIFEK